MAAFVMKKLLNVLSVTRIIFTAVVQSYPDSRRPTNRRFDPSTICPNTQKIVFPRSISIASAPAHRPSLQDQSRRQAVLVVQYYSCSLFFIAFLQLLNKTSGIMGSTIKSKTNAKTGVVIRLIVNRQRSMEPVDAD
jgi:hypothetical protein